MKMRPWPAFGIAALAGSVLLLDLYAFTGKPAPAGDARVELPAPVGADSAQSGSGESEAAQVSVNPGGSAEQVPREGQGSMAGESLRGVLPVFAPGRPSLDAGGRITADSDSPPEIRPARVAAPSPPVSSRAPAGPDDASSSALVPLAFRPLPPALAAANPQLADALHGLQQDFVDAVGPNQNPNDPAYYQRWVTAQANIDERYRLMVGNEAFLIEQTTVNNR